MFLTGVMLFLIANVCYIKILGGKIMSEAAKKEKNVLYFIIYCMIVALGWIIPPVAPITTEGMHLLGVFIAAVFGWSVTSEVWPSFLTLLLLPFTGMTTFTAVLSMSFGSDTIVFMMLLFVLVAFLEETGATTYVAAFVMSRKFLQGHPWRLLFMVFTVGWLLSSFTNNFAGMFVTWGFIYKICAVLDYKPFDKFSNLLIFGVAVMGALSLSTLPWAGNALIILGSWMASSGAVVNYLHYFAYSLPVGIFSILGYLALCKFVFKLDVSRLQNFDPNIFDEKDKALTAERKIALGALLTLVLIILIPSILPVGNPIRMISDKVGLSLKAGLVFAVLTLIRINGKQVFNFGALAAKGIPWPALTMAATIMCFVALLGSADAGIGAFLGQLFTPMFSGASVIVFFLLVLAITVFLTNFMVNVVIAVIMLAATLPVASNLGIDALQVVYLITVSCTIAFMLPAASAASACLFSNTEWVRAKDVYKYGFPTIIMMAIVTLLWNIILFMF